MDIRKPKTIGQAAGQRLEASPQKQQVMLLYCGIVLVQCAVITALNYLVDHLLGQAGGLGNLGQRTLLSTFAMVLPILHTLALLVLDVGLLNAMLRVARGQYISVHSLRMGLSRFWGVISCTFFRGLVCLAAGFAALNVAMVVFLASPLSSGMMKMLEPMLTETTDTTVLVNELLSNEALTMEYIRTTLPLYLIFAAVFLVLLVPLLYRLRFSEYILIDNPRFGGFRASLESLRMTRRRWFPLLKLDIFFWWYHVLSLLVGLLSYMDLLPGLLGFAHAPATETTALVFYGLYLVAQVLVYYFFRPRLEVSFALLYEAYRPKEEPGQAVVLGNIFQM